MADRTGGDRFPTTARTSVRRLPGRSSHDRVLIEAILDEAVICHVGFAIDGQPYVLPMNYGRCGDHLYLHGHRESRMLRHLAGGAEACVSVTLLDGLVLADSACEHSVNYRSVVLFGAARRVVDDGERIEALRCITNHFVPGRWAEVREPTAGELAEVLIVAIPINEASVKVRTVEPAGGGSANQAIWVGLVPIGLTAGAPVAASSVPPGVAAPAFARRRVNGPR
jgi:nitroimidazol reductase NimA-like FMN-containing flavoprotein (pyridoxamine 5'-phosphate oxidase superfamily)